MIKVSCIIAVLNSHRIVRKQLLHFAAMPLPESVELIIMDDGSNPPLSFPDSGIKNFRLLQTNDTRLWTQGLARMEGARHAIGEYLFFTDIDHVISKAAIEASLVFTGDRMMFRREFGILTNTGRIVQNVDALLRFGLSQRIVRRRGVSAGCHMNTFLIRKSAWFEIGQYSLIRASSQKHTMGEDRDFNRRWSRAVRTGKYQAASMGPAIYVYPIGRFRDDGDVNPFGLFHDSPRDDLGG